MILGQNDMVPRDMIHIYKKRDTPQKVYQTLKKKKKNRSR